MGPRSSSRAQATSNGWDPRRRPSTTLQPPKYSALRRRCARMVAQDRRRDGSRARTFDLRERPRILDSISGSSADYASRRSRGQRRGRLRWALASVRFITNAAKKIPIEAKRVTGQCSSGIVLDYVAVATRDSAASMLEILSITTPCIGRASTQTVSNRT